MGWLLGTFGVSIASALLPLINIEAYLGAVAAGRVGAVWPLATVAALGQMIGKVGYYFLGRSSLEWDWVRRRADTPKFRARLATWQRRIGDRPLLGGLVIFASATVGLPPLAIVSVIAGSLRLSLPVFFVVGFVGRVLRFASILGAVGWFVTQ